MVKCKDCGQEMLKAESCKFPMIKINGKIYKRNTTYFDFNKRCHDCGIINAKGNIHHWGCDIERCPRCKRQLIACNCKIEGLVRKRVGIQTKQKKKKGWHRESARHSLARKGIKTGRKRK